MADVDKRDAMVGALEVVVFEVAGQVDVGTDGHGIVNQKTACPAADGYSMDGGADDVADAQEWQAEALLNLPKETGGVGGMGEASYKTGPHLLLQSGQRTQDVPVGQLQPVGQDAVDTSEHIIEVGVGGIGGNVVLYQPHHQSSGGIAGGDALHAAEDKGMVGDNQVGTFGYGLIDHLVGEVEGNEYAAAFLRGVAYQKTGIVVVLLILRVKCTV